MSSGSNNVMGVRDAIPRFTPNVPRSGSNAARACNSGSPEFTLPTATLDDEMFYRYLRLSLDMDDDVPAALLKD